MNQRPPVAPRNDSRALPARQYGSDHTGQQLSWSRANTMQCNDDYAKVSKPHLRTSHSTKARVISSYDHYTVDETENRPRARSKTTLEQAPEYDEDLYLSASEIASLPTDTKSQAISSNYRSTTPTKMFPAPPEPQQQCKNIYVALPQTTQPFAPQEAAIYGIAQGKGENLLMEYQQVQKMTKRFYKKLIKTNADSPDIAELKMHLRLSQTATVPEMISSIHQSMKPPTSAKKEQKEEDEKMYLIDFQDCKDKQKLRDQILQLFTTPGPPSVAYQRVNAKMDNLINVFTDIVIKMRLLKNTTILSPAHAQNVLGQESEQLIRLLQANELWIRWGTETGLPPITHLYMLKQPPSYEMRKAATISLISKKKDVLKLLLNSRTRQEVLMPPIYSKLESQDQRTRWQVSEFDPESRKFQSRECVLPTWLEECGKLVSHFYSGNRTTFGSGDHIYALYSVYLIVIKDVTLTEDRFEKDSRIPCAHQIYVGCSSTGVLYRFLNIENSHCENIKRTLEEVPALESYRCYQKCELVEACLALSWIRRQPRAVFVINSFQEGNMSNLSLSKKKPFHDKMVDLKQHYISSKKLGPLYDMRFGMNNMGERFPDQI